MALEIEKVNVQFSKEDLKTTEGNELALRRFLRVMQQMGQTDSSQQTEIDDLTTSLEVIDGGGP